MNKNNMIKKLYRILVCCFLTAEVLLNESTVYALEENQKNNFSDISTDCQQEYISLIYTRLCLAYTDLSGSLGIGPDTKADVMRLIYKIGGMKRKKNGKYPDLYYKGNKMVIGLNLDADIYTNKNIYLYIENNGNKSVKYYKIKIGEKKAAVLRKLEKMHYQTYDKGKSYSNSNASAFYPVFKKGKLKSYKYICAPTG